jgi:hypothetical protein
MNLDPMGTPMSDRLRRPVPATLWAGALLCGAIAWGPSALAQAAAPATAASAAPLNSAMDDRLFYQLLIGEMALGSGDAGSAYELILDAARRTRDEGLLRWPRRAPGAWQGPNRPMPCACSCRSCSR